MDEGSHLTSFSSPSKSSITPTTDKMKVEIKLQTYDGTPDTCTDWFFVLEKNLARMKIDGADFLCYATGHTTGTAKDASLSNKD